MKEKYKNERLFLNGFFQGLYDHFVPYKQNKGRTPSTEDILHDLSLPVLENIRKGAHEEFKRQFLHLIDAHVHLLTESGYAKDKRINFAMIPTYSKWLGFEQFREWPDVYRQIISECIRKLESDNRFFHTCCHYLVFHLYARVSTVVPGKITQHIIMWATFVFNSLSQDIQKKAIVALNKGLDSGEDIPFPIYLHNLYDPELKYFISCWENLEQTIIHEIYNDGKISRDGIADLKTHLAETVLMILQSVVNRDRDSSEWLVDTYLRWNDAFLHFNQRNQSRFFNRGFSRTYSSIYAELDSLESEEGSDSKAREQKLLIIDSFQNLWFDTSVIAFGVLWNFWKGKKSILAQNIAARLYIKAPVDNSSRLISIQEDMDDVLSILRSYVRLTTDHKYHSLVKGDYGRGVDIPTEGARVPGRAYVTSGHDYQRETFSLLLVLLVVKHNNRGPLSRELSRSTVDYVLEDGERFENIINSFSSFKLAFDSVELSEIVEAVRVLLDKYISEKDAKKYKLKAWANVRLLRRTLNARYNANIANLNIDQDDIAQVQNEIHKRIFTDINSVYPICLFNDLQYLNDELSEKAAQSFIDCPRELFLKNNSRVRKDYWPNKDVYIREYSRRIPYWPLQIALDRSPKRRLEAADGLIFWEHLVNIVDSIRGEGRSPLILSGTVWPRFLREWDNYQYDPQNMSAPPQSYVRNINQEFLDKYERDYKGHLYNTPVFHVPKKSGFIIIAQEKLSAVKYRQYDDGDCLQLSYEPYEKFPHKGTIKVRWEYDVIVDGSVITEIDWNTQSQESNMVDDE